MGLSSLRTGAVGSSKVSFARRGSGHTREACSDKMICQVDEEYDGKKAKAQHDNCIGKDCVCSGNCAFELGNRDRIIICHHMPSGAWKARCY
jgi:hypothetical protein